MVLLAYGDENPIDYTLPEFERVTGVRYLSHLDFMTMAIREKVKNSYPDFLIAGQVAQQARWLKTLYTKEFAAGSVADVCIRWIDDTVGFGVFTARSLPKGAYIGEYTGILRRKGVFSLDTNAYCFTYPSRRWSLRTYMIDAARYGNETRFINHSDTPNIAPSYLIDDDGIAHIVFIATAALPAGVQLTIDYGAHYWRKRLKVAL